MSPDIDKERGIGGGEEGGGVSGMHNTHSQYFTI